MKKWINGANTIFKVNKIDIELKIKNSQKDLSFDELFGIDNKQVTESDFPVEKCLFRPWHQKLGAFPFILGPVKLDKALFPEIEINVSPFQ